MAKQEIPGIRIVKEIHYPLFDVFLRNDGIVHIVHAANAWFTLKEGKEIVAALKDITEGVPHLLLLTPEQHVGMDAECVQYLASKEATHYYVARALVAHSIAHKLIGNLFARFRQTEKPSKMFVNIDDAVEWLHNQTP